MKKVICTFIIMILMTTLAGCGANATTTETNDKTAIALETKIQTNAIKTPENKVSADITIEKMSYEVHDAAAPSPFSYDGTYLITVKGTKFDTYPKTQLGEKLTVGNDEIYFSIPQLNDKISSVLTRKELIPIMVYIQHRHKDYNKDPDMPQGEVSIFVFESPEKELEFTANISADTVLSISAPHSTMTVDCKKDEGTTQIEMHLLGNLLGSSEFVTHSDDVDFGIAYCLLDTDSVSNITRYLNWRYVEYPNPTPSFTTGSN